MIVLALLLVSVLVGGTSIIMAMRFAIYLKKWRRTSGNRGTWRPPVTVVMPCRGVDPGFRENIRAVLGQDYEDYEVVFVTAGKEDPAYGLLEELIREDSRGRGRLCTAGVSDRRSQMVTNELVGISAARSTSEILVIFDSDIRPSAGFLGELISPLSGKKVGLATGFRWYLPVAKTIFPVVRSAWNGAALPLLVDQRHNFAYGGAMAFRRSVYEELKIEELLDRAVTDDFPISLAVKDAGLKVVFVPTCLVLSHEDASLAEVIEWTNRQTIISHVYHPTFWWTVAVVYVFAELIALGGGVGAFVSAISVQSWGATLIVPAAIIVACQMVTAFIVVTAVAPVLGNYSARLLQLRWWYVVLAPVAAAVILINVMVSSVTRTITWRGITYELVSPTETRVLGMR